MAKLSMGIKDKGGTLFSSKSLSGDTCSNIDMQSHPSDIPTINTNTNVQNPMGGAEDLVSSELPFPLSLIPAAPSRIVTNIPLQEYMSFLPVAAASLAVSLIVTSKEEVQERNENRK